MPIITPDGDLLNPRIIHTGTSNWGELGEVLMFRVHENDDDDFGRVFLVAFMMGSPGYSWYIGTIEDGLKRLHNQHNYHKIIYDECDPYDWFKKDEDGNPYDMEEIAYPNEGKKVIEYCLAEGIIRFGTDEVVHIQKWIDYPAQK